MTSIFEVISEFVLNPINSLDHIRGTKFDSEFSYYCLCWGVTYFDICIWSFLFKQTLLSNKTDEHYFEEYRIMRNYYPSDEPSQEEIGELMAKNFILSC